GSVTIAALVTTPGVARSRASSNRRLHLTSSRGRSLQQKRPRSAIQRCPSERDRRTPSLRLPRILQLLQGATPPESARTLVRACADRHLRRRDAHRGVRGDQPARTTPVLSTPDGPLPESNAILVYLANGTTLLPTDPFQLAQVIRWHIYEQTDVIPTMGGLRFRLLVGRLTADDPEAQQRKKGALEVLRLLDEHLAERTYFVGDHYSIADIAIY